MPKLEVLIGMIASGKSTYARKRADEGALVICHDDLTQMLHARYRYEPGLKGLYRQLMMGLAWDCLATGRDVIIDRTHLTREARAIWIEFVRGARGLPGFPDGELELVAVTFTIENARVHTNRRMLSDPRGRPFEEWDAVAKHHIDQAMKEPLDWKAEGFDSHVHIEGLTPSHPDVPTPQPVRS